MVLLGHCRLVLVAGHWQCDRASLLSWGLNLGPPEHVVVCGCRVPLSDGACERKEKKRKGSFILFRFIGDQFSA